MLKKFIIALSLVLLATLVTSGCSLFGEKEETQETTKETTTTDANTGLATSNLTNIDPTSIDATITKNYADAKSKAAQWKSDATLATVSVKFPTNLAGGESNETYVFGSATEPNYWFSYSVSESTDKFIRAIIPKEDYLGTDIKPINTTYWKMNYIKAFQLAEAAKGKEFRTQNANSQITATLHHTTPKGWLWWEIAYKSATTGKSLILKVNPSDNNVVDENGNPISTSTDSSTKSTTDNTQTQ